jgi:transposase-like protein
MSPSQRQTTRDKLARFADELSAYEWIETILWPNGAKCPHCGSEGRIGKLNGASTRIGTYKCYNCRKTFAVTYGTIFAASHVPLHKWLQAIYLTDGGNKPMRPHHLQQILNVSFKTASSMMQRISEAAASEPSNFGRSAGAPQKRLNSKTLP